MEACGVKGKRGQVKRRRGKQGSGKEGAGQREWEERAA